MRGGKEVTHGERRAVVRRQERRIERDIADAAAGDIEAGGLAEGGRQRGAPGRGGVVSGAPWSAARNAALSAILRMLPPVTLRRASLPKSSASVGAAAGT